MGRPWYTRHYHTLQLQRSSLQLYMFTYMLYYIITTQQDRTASVFRWCRIVQYINYTFSQLSDRMDGVLWWWHLSLDMYKWLLSYYNMEQELICRIRCDHLLAFHIDFIACVGLLTCYAVITITTQQNTPVTFYDTKHKLYIHVYTSGTNTGSRATFDTTFVWFTTDNYVMNVNNDCT